MIDNQQQRVNLAELLEVRSNGLSASEILTILASSCENLIRAANRRGLFTIEQIFLSREGRIEIQLIQIGDTPKQWIPPELLEQSQPFGHDTSDSHLVWCLGKSCAQASAADHSDVALFSLLNLMTVDHLQSRPSLQKVRQMVRNRLNLVDFDRMPEIVVGLYREVLGDLDELINDPFGDDIRFSSQRSSQLSIIPGPGAPEHRERRDLEAYQQELTSEVESRLRRDFSLSRKHQMAKDLPLDEVIDIPDKLHVQHQKPVPSPRRGLSPAAVDLKKEEEEETEVEEELTPRGPSPMEEIGEWGKARAEDYREEFVPLGSQEVDQLLGTSKTEWQRFGDTPREEDTQKEQKQHQLHHPGNPFDDPDEEEADEVANVPTALESQKSPTEVANSRPNAESIQVEVHTPSQPIASSQSSTSVLPSHHPHPPHPQHGSESSTAESTSKSPSPHPKTTRLYAKATHGAASKPSRGVAAKKTPEIEVLHSDEGKMKNDAKKEAETKWEPISLWEADGEAPGVTTTFPAEEVDSIEHASYQKVQPVKVEAQPQQFQRQNSLQPARCSRRASTGGAARRRPEARHVGGGLPAVPEFLSNSTQPSIRLRAQSMKRKKVIALHRAEPAVVFVRLLNGHTVEVNCKSDQLVGAIFHTVAEHLNITEHLFFGLVLQQQQLGGEFIFLEEEHRLEKWAPPGWKNSGGGSSGQRRSLGIADSASRSPFAAGGGADQFVLHLRFRYYPKKREFVKTATTAHQLYLQLRQDMLNGTLRFQPRENALEMAALALCVECGRPPATAGDYFKMENYLPSKFYELEPGEVLRVQREIGTLHTQLADQMGRLEAEERFIALCQSEPYYGAHFYRVHKMKPKRGQQPFLADMRLVAVMPSGIGICREERGASRRLFTSLHEWHHIRTLQFDRKRFLLGTVENGIAVDHVFYTDHHTKSAYLVRFAASQHRFMLKMRQWQGTLNRMRAMQRHKDVGVEVAERGIVGNDAGGQKKEEASEVHGREERLVEAALGQEVHRRLGSQPQMGLAGGGGGQRELLGDEGTAQTHQNRLLAETDSEYIKYCYGPDAQRVDVVLEKHPELGLGLTLVDGAVNGVKGVYVKSVSAEGDGRRKGLLIGDCLLSINGISLFNRTRHDAVELVRECDREVRLEVLRFPSISEVLAQEPVLGGSLNGGKLASTSASSPPRMFASTVEGGESMTTTTDGSVPQPISSARRRASSSFRNESAKESPPQELGQNKRKESTLTNQSRTSAESAGTPQSAGSAQHRRLRAVSDFGPFGGHLPALRTEDILAAVTPKGRRPDEHRAQRYRRHKTSAGFPESRNSDSDDGASTDSEQADEGQLRSGGSHQNGGGDGVDPSSGSPTNRRRGEYLPGKEQQLPPVSAMYGTLEDEEEEEEEPSPSDEERRRRGYLLQKQTTTMAMSSPYLPNNNSAEGSHTFEHSPFAVAIERYGRPTNTTCDNNGGQQPRTNLDWTNELSDFDSISSPDSLQTTQRGTEQQQQQGTAEDSEVIKVILNKTGTSPIGLSLAKRTGYEGVYIRNVAPDSLAAKEGNLRVGDRVWRIHGERLSADESPANVVKKLKEMDGRLEIEVKRRST